MRFTFSTLLMAASLAWITMSSIVQISGNYFSLADPTFKDLSLIVISFFQDDN
jgi:hypothetical protein